MTAEDAESVAVDEVARRADRVRNRIADAGGSPEAVTLIAVTKGFDASVAATALAAGLADLGENYAQELTTKAADLAAGGSQHRLGSVQPRWHAIGRLQRNKVRLLAPVVTLWQSVDRPELIDEIARRAPGAAVLIQLNLSGEPTKGGCAPSDTSELVARGLDAGLDVRGLMGVGPAGDAADARPGFESLVALADELGLSERSMGMSADLEVAVAAGSTMVRVGGALFGPRLGLRRSDLGNR